MSDTIWYCEDHESPQFVESSWCQFLASSDGWKGLPCAFTLMRMSRVRDESPSIDGGAYGDGSDLGEFMVAAKRQADSLAKESS